MSAWVPLPVPVPVPRTFVLSRHARRRMDEMGVAVDQLNRMLAEPQLVRPARRACLMYQGEADGLRFAAVVCPGEEDVVVTVLPWVAERYVRPEKLREGPADVV